MPLRFFCNTCRQLLKIGHTQAGTVIVCPKCRNNVVVPFKSQPKAEELYQFIKRKNIELEAEEAARNKPPLLQALHRANKQASYDNLQLYLKETLSKNAPAASVLSQEDQLERWIDEFWKNNEWKAEEPQPVQTPPAKKPSTVTKAAASVPQVETILDELDSAAYIVRLEQQIKTLRFLLAIAVFSGCLLGFFGNILLTKNRNADERILTTANVLQGMLQYKSTTGDLVPDTDALAFFIPLEAKPLIPLDGKGLRPGEQLNTEAVRQIEEWDGKVLRCDANGEFLFEFKPEKPYLILLVSAHIDRKDKPLAPGVTVKLRKFFNNPADLIGDAAFLLKEEDWKAGRLLWTQELTE